MSLTSILLFLKKLWDNRTLVGIVLFLCVVFSFYAYHIHASSRIDSLTRENTQLQLVIEQQKKAIESIKTDYKKIIAAKEELAQEIKNTQTEVEELREKLYRENLGKKPLEELATKKTSLIEKKINKATEEALRCIELLTRGGDC
jgi:septal ring factor EnvC (AmiA/AmiB activator)